MAGEEKTRTGDASRETDEVNIKVNLTLDAGENPKSTVSLAAENLETGIELWHFEHMIEQLFRFARIEGEVIASGDTSHHVIEDTAMCLGQALNKALGNRAGIARTASHVMPMEGIAVGVAIDLSNRPYLRLDSEEKMALPFMLEHFLWTFALHTVVDIFLNIDTGGKHDNHHVMETTGKALGMVLRAAATIEGKEVLSTKGTLT